MIMSNVTKVDPSVLSFIPKATYYTSLEDNIASVETLWGELFNFDRELFALLTLLPGSNYSKSRMMHYLLSDSVNKGINKKQLSKYTLLNSEVESKLVLYNLKSMPMSASLRALLMFTGKDYGKKKLTKINNTRARKIILNYVFDRSDSSLEAMVVKYKAKIKKLVKHAFGSRDLYKILTLTDGYKKVLKKYCRNMFNGEVFDLNRCLSVIFFVFDNESFIFNNAFANSKSVKFYKRFKKLAKEGDIDKISAILDEGVLPYEVVLGFRNFYKLNMDLKTVHAKGKKSAKTTFKTLEASKRHGVEDVKVDFSKQSLADLYKYVYLKQIKDYELLAETINDKLYDDKRFNVDLGRVAVLVDASDSMRGHETKPYHPIITALLTANKFDYSLLVIAGGVEGKLLIEPKGNTELWTGMIDVLEAHSDIDTLVVISDGYENTIDGLFEHVYKAMINMGYDFKIIHVNPVYDANVGGGKPLLDGVQPISISDPNMFETNYILTQVGSDLKNVKRLLIDIYNNKIGGDQRGLLP